MLRYYVFAGAPDSVCPLLVPEQIPFPVPQPFLNRSATVPLLIFFIISPALEATALVMQEDLHVVSAVVKARKRAHRLIKRIAKALDQKTTPTISSDEVRRC